MVRCSIFVVRGLLFAVLCTSSLSAASIGLTSESSFTVPSLDSAIAQVKFADLDGDGSPELLATDGRNLVLYSVTGDSILFDRHNDSTVRIVRMELADVTRDSIVDIVISYCLDYGLPPNRPDDSLWPVVCYDGSTGFIDSSCYYLTRDEGVWGDLSFPGALVAADVNEDGYNELVLGCTDGAFSPIGGYFLIDGATRLFYHFPDSLAWTKRFAARELYHVTLADSSAAWVGLLESNFYGEYPGGDRQSRTFRLSRIDSAGTAHSWVDDDDLVTACSPNDDRSESEGQHFGCFGDIDTLDPATDLLTWSYLLVECPPGGMMIDSTRLELRRLASPDSTELLWSREMGLDDRLDDLGPFAFLPAFRGYVVGFSADTLLLISGADGSAIAKTPGQPTGLRNWQDLYGDGDLRLVIADSDKVTFYRLDISTDVTDRDEHTLPNSFALGQPYPNPFNAEVTIPLEISERADVAVDVLDLLGRRVTSLHQGRLPAGRHTVRWNAERVASGVYLVRAQSSGQTRTAKLVLLK
jgi:hypothetical protein